MKRLWRAVVEIGFIVFLFYSNLLMGEFERSSSGHGKTLGAALSDIMTTANLTIAQVCALIGYLIVEYLRNEL